MNNIRKEKLRIANLVMEIDERGIRSMSFDSGRNNECGGNLCVWTWPAEGAPELRMADVSNLPDLRKIRHDLENILRSGLASLAKQMRKRETQS